MPWKNNKYKRNDKKYKKKSTRGLKSKWQKNKQTCLQKRLEKIKNFFMAFLISSMKTLTQ